MKNPLARDTALLTIEQSIDWLVGHGIERRRGHKKESLTNTYKTHATDGDNFGLMDIDSRTGRSYETHRISSLRHRLAASSTDMAALRGVQLPERSANRSRHIACIGPPCSAQRQFGDRTIAPAHALQHAHSQLGEERISIRMQRQKTPYGKPRALLPGP